MHVPMIHKPGISINAALGFCFVIVFLLSCREHTSPDDCILKGKTVGFENGTKVYLLDLFAYETVDSTAIKKNRFELRHTLKRSPSKMMLLTEDGQVSPYLWLEPGHMVYDATSRDFYHATVSGSKTQEVYDRLILQLDSTEIRDSLLAILPDFISSHPDNRAGADLLAQYMADLPQKVVDSLFLLLSEENRLSEYGQRIARSLDAEQPPDVGDRFVDFEMNNIQDQPVRLSENLGRATLLVFWASWCDSCRTVNAFVSSLKNEFSDRGLIVLGISLDHEKEDWAAAIRNDSLYWIHVTDFLGRDNLAALNYGVSTVPYFILLDENGVVADRNPELDDLRSQLEDLLH